MVSGLGVTLGPTYRFMRDATTVPVRYHATAWAVVLSSSVHLLVLHCAECTCTDDASYRSLSQRPHLNFTPAS